MYSTPPSNKVVSLIATQTTMSLSQSKSLPNHLWNAARVKNFMRALDLKPTKWNENIVALAKTGSMSVKKFMNTNPIAFAEKVFYNKLKCRDILGGQIYSEMVRFRELDSLAEAEKAARYAAAVEADERYYAGRTHEQVVADEEAAEHQAKLAKEAVEAVVEKQKKRAAELEAWKRKSIRVIWKTGDPPLSYSLDDWFAGKIVV